ncbi:MAG: DNA mismatch endonuclease Vsr [Ignavibacteria bacterium]|nr:DNA mismatch endonuclease Vsr [Ignavibacteria bacterium]
MDIWTKDKRSDVMSKIGHKNTKPEILLRKELFQNGFRYRVNDKRLPGKPDIVMKKYNLIIMVNGCFWHYHKNCPEGRIPDTNKLYWKQKLLNNIRRDKKNIYLLKKLGLKTMVFWECEIEKHLPRILSKIKKHTKCCMKKNILN